jgi:hypothetical protein
MARLLVVHHTPSPALQEVLERVVGGARDDAIDGVEVVLRPALTASPVDVLEADGYLLGTPANLGYLSGALKHFFDTIYYPCLEATRGRPFGAWVQATTTLRGRCAPWRPSQPGWAGNEPHPSCRSPARSTPPCGRPVTSWALWSRRRWRRTADAPALAARLRPSAAGLRRGAAASGR